MFPTPIGYGGGGIERNIGKQLEREKVTKAIIISNRRAIFHFLVLLLESCPYFTANLRTTVTAHNNANARNFALPFFGFVLRACCKSLMGRGIEGVMREVGEGEDKDRCNRLIPTLHFF